MISRSLKAISAGARYVLQHPQILFTLVLLLVLPTVILFTADQFLDVGRENQNTLQKARVGLMQDSFVAMMHANDYDAMALQPIIESLAEVNPDITKFRISRLREGGVFPVMALNEDIVGVPEAGGELYRTATIRPDESIIVPFYIDNARHWQVFRYIGNHDGSDWFLLTELSLANIDSALAARENTAYLLLIPVFLFVFLLAYWQFRNTDYRHLYLQAEEANKTRDLFTSMITHELRAPLTAMRGYASLIEESQEATVTSRTHASRIRQSTERLLSIVNDLLEVARIQSGRLQVSRKTVNLSEVIRNVIFELKSSADPQKIALTHTGTEDPITIETDEKRLYQILVNLVSNAIKYTEQGRIEVSLVEKRKEVEIRVKDTGMGIDAEDQQKLFAPFFRVENDNVDKITGTGLGMWITKQLIEMLDGSVGVESIKGVGTNVVIQFPKQLSTDPLTKTTKDRAR